MCTLPPLRAAQGFCAFPTVLLAVFPRRGELLRKSLLWPCRSLSPPETFQMPGAHGRVRNILTLLRPRTIAQFASLCNDGEVHRGIDGTCRGRPAKERKLEGSYRKRSWGGRNVWRSSIASFSGSSGKIPKSRISRDFKI